MSSTPSIRIEQHQRYQGPETYPPFSAASPMAIPRARQPVPPPLPPPTYIPEISAGADPGWQWGNDPNGADFGRPASVKPGSSLLGGAAKSSRQGKEQDFGAQYPLEGTRRGSSISTITLGRDSEMHDGTLSHVDEDTNSSRPTSNGYVDAFSCFLVDVHLLFALNSKRPCTETAGCINQPQRNLRILQLTIIQFSAAK